MPGKPIFPRDFSEFVESLNVNDVRYLVVGGYAVAFHGHPRYTKDLDIWIARDAENAKRLVRALQDFGFGSIGFQIADFTEADQIIQLGEPPLRIDLLTTVEGLDFEACYPSAKRVEIEGIQVTFIDLENLKKNKRAVGRAQDLADLENLRK